MITKKDILNCLKSPITLVDWYSQALIKRDPSLWVFGSWSGNLYEDNSRALFEWVNENAPQIDAVWLTNKDDIYQLVKQKGYKVAKINSKEGRSLCRHAGVAICSWGWQDLNRNCINGAKKIWLWHGVGMKTMDIISHQKDKNRWKNIKTSIRKILLPSEFQQFDFTIVPSATMKPLYAKMFKVADDKVLVTGLPRNDNFYSTKREPFIISIDKKFNSPTKILYMPTFRDDATAAGKPFNPFNKFNFEIQKVAQTLEKTNAVLIYKGHFCDIEYGCNNGNPLGERFIQIAGNEYDNQYLFIKDCDILMTDYSSIYADWILSKKPIILAPFDYEIFLRNSRSFHYGYEIMDGDIVNNWEEWCELVGRGEYKPISENCFKFFSDFEDGKNSERVYNEILKLLQ